MLHIQYSGEIEDRGIIQQLEEEFIDISRISGWKYELVKEDFHTLTSKKRKRGFIERLERHSYEIYGEEELEEPHTLASSEVYLEGIILKIGNGVDPVKFTFDKKGKLANISFYSKETTDINDKFTVKKYEFLYYPYIRIHTFNAEEHIKVIKILDYVKKRYIKNLEVIDSSFYWDTRDDEYLRVKMWKSRKNKRIIL